MENIFDNYNDSFNSYLLSPIFPPISSSSSQNNDLNNSRDEQIPDKENYYPNLNNNIVKSNQSNGILIQTKTNGDLSNKINLLDKANLINSITHLGNTSSNTKLIENLTKNGGTQNFGTITFFQESMESNHEPSKKNEQYNYNDNNNESQHFLNEKRKKKLKDKGLRKNQMLNVYKSNFIKVVHKECVKMAENTNFYSHYKTNFNKINNKIYINENSSNNLLFLDMKLKNVLSLENENNEFIINKVDENNDNSEYSPLKQILEKTILDLMYYYSNKFDLRDLKEEFAQHLRKEYDELIHKLEKERHKSPEYIQIFKNIINNIQKEYQSMKDNNVGKKKKAI